jgi:hypothetical protein
MHGRSSAFSRWASPGGSVANKTVRVLMLDRKWAVVRAEDSVPLSMHDRRQDAVDCARTIASREGAKLIVFDIGGRPLSQDLNETSP